jgi:hypothetical protein
MPEKERNEAGVRDPVCEYYAEVVGVLHVRNVFRPGPAVGFPDDTFYFDYGRSLHIEFKAPGKKPSRKQEDKIARLRDAGQLVLIIDNVEEGKQAIDAVNESGHFHYAPELEKHVCLRAGTKYRGLVTQCRKIEAW